jgi:Zn-dependent protease with chaperone function
LNSQPTIPALEQQEGSALAADAPVEAADSPVEYVDHARLPVNDLASSYQPRRVWAAGVSIGWNLLLAGLFVGSGAARHLLAAMAPGSGGAGFTLIAPIYFGLLFGGYALFNLPLELWFGYLGERQFGLAKDGIRAWARDWVIGNLQHGTMFVAGACLILAAQAFSPGLWLLWLAAGLLALFVGTTYFAADLIPPGLFNFQQADAATVERLRGLLPAVSPPLPGVVVYTHTTIREYAGGFVGLANRQRYLISRSTLASASDGLLRFVLLHDLGHRRYHHNLLAALAGWAWVVIGLAVSHACIPGSVFGSPVYVAFLGLALSGWMAIGEPVLAYVGRRLEYQADRFYLRSGGTLDEMRAALSELAQRNLARTEMLRRRQTIFHPLPSVTNRLYRAKEFVEARKVH